MKDHISDQKILRRLAQESSEDKSFPDLDSLVGTPQGQGLLAGIVASVKGEDIASAPGDDDVRRATAQLLEKINGVSQKASQPQKSGLFRQLGTAWTTSIWSAGAIAATVLVILAWNMGVSGVEDQLASSASTYTTGNKQQAAITLPDGSEVVLNVGSRLEIPSDYATGNRTLVLDGEAYFTVKPDKRAPFTVNSGSATARVLGTRFVVRHYGSDTTTAIAVKDGKVAVGDVVLTAGEETYVSSGMISPVRETDARRFSFVLGKLALSSQLLTDAIPDLNRWYDVDIRIGDSALRERRIVGVFETGSITDLISLLELTYNVRVVRDGQTLTLFSEE